MINISECLQGRTGKLRGFGKDTVFFFLGLLLDGPLKAWQVIKPAIVKDDELTNFKFAHSQQ